MEHEQRVRIAFRVARLAQEAGHWTDETALEYCSQVDRGLMSDQTLLSFEQSAEREARQQDEAEDES